jgi:hypothetical protein
MALMKCSQCDKDAVTAVNGIWYCQMHKPQQAKQGSDISIAPEMFKFFNFSNKKK